MEGVYVYHWYRADAFHRRNPRSTAQCGFPGDRDQLPEDGSQATLDGAGGWGRVPITGHRILLIGHDVGAAAEHSRLEIPHR